MLTFLVGVIALILVLGTPIGRALLGCAFCVLIWLGLLLGVVWFLYAQTPG